MNYPTLYRLALPWKDFSDEELDRIMGEPIARNAFYDASVNQYHCNVLIHF